MRKKTITVNLIRSRSKKERMMVIIKTIMVMIILLFNIPQEQQYATFQVPDVAVTLTPSTLRLVQNSRYICVVVVVVVVVVVAMLINRT